MPVRTTRLQDGSFRATSQGPGLAVQSGEGRPGRLAHFASFLRGKPAAASPMGPVESGMARDSLKKVPLQEERRCLGRSESPDREIEQRPERTPRDGDALLDPLCRALASGVEWRAPEPVPNAAPEPTSAAARVSLENVIDKLVRRIAWSGNGRAGAMRIELGAGALSGATLLVQADGSDVRVTLDLPPGTDAAGWRERLSQRFAARGLRVAELEIR